MKKSDVKDDLVTVQKKGNSPGFTIPKAPAEKFRIKEMNEIIPNRLSDNLYDAIEKMKYTIDDKGQKLPNGLASTVWIHLADAVSRGHITPMEAWDTLSLGYVAEHLLVRESAYSHLI